MVGKWLARRRNGVVEQTLQSGKFICPREGVERPWRLISLHGRRQADGGPSIVGGAAAKQAHDSALVCDGCEHRYRPEAGRPISDAERSELAEVGLMWTLAALGHERVADQPARAAAVDAELTGVRNQLPQFDAFEYEALLARLDARLLPPQRERLVAAACRVSIVGRPEPFVSASLLAVGTALGYTAEQLQARLG